MATTTSTVAPRLIARDPTPALTRVAPLLVTLLAILFANLAWFSQVGVNCQVDEYIDTHIALDLSGHPLVGPGWDGSQARLPHYLPAGAYAVARLFRAGADERYALELGRAVSVAAGVAALGLAYAVGRRCFGTVAALVATALLAISPYVLGLTRDVGTDGDAYCPAAVLLALLAFLAYQQRRTALRAALLGVAIGVMIAAKFTLAVIAPALTCCDLVDVLLDHRAARAGRQRGVLEATDRLPSRPRWLLALWSIVTAGCFIGALAMTRKLGLIAEHQAHALPVTLWAAGALLLAGGLVTVIATRTQASGATDKDRPRALSVSSIWPGEGKTLTSSADSACQWHPSMVGVLSSWLADWLAIAGLSVAGVLAFPEHALHPDIAGAFLNRAEGWDGGRPFGAALRNGRVYAGLVLLKLGLPFGILTLLALVWAGCRALFSRPLRLLLAALAAYGLLLAALPVAAHFYLLSIYPPLVLILAAFLVRVPHWFRLPALRWGWLGLHAACWTWLLWGVVHVYPTFTYYGYETTGDMWAGSYSRGYKDVIQVTNDGTWDALDWCVQHVPAGKKVRSFLWDEHVMKWFIERQPGGQVPFEILWRHPKEQPKPPAIDDADYLIVALQNKVSSRDCPKAEEIAKWYKPEPVFKVTRGRGRYRMDVLWVYEKR